jgi:hypothetical protein
MEKLVTKTSGGKARCHIGSNHCFDSEWEESERLYSTHAVRSDYILKRERKKHKGDGKTVEKYGETEATEKSNN